VFGDEKFSGVVIEKSEAIGTYPVNNKRFVYLTVGG
jgi:hypothetical protein